MKPVKAKSDVLLQVGLLCPLTLPRGLLDMPIYRTQFKAWLQSQLRKVSPKTSNLGLQSTLELKAHGLSAAGVNRLSHQTQYVKLVTLTL